MPTSTKVIPRDQRIVDAFAAGRSIPEIALAGKVGPQTVQAALRRHGVAYPRGRGASRPNVPLDLANPEWLEREYATKTGRQIAQELGCAKEEVFEALGDLDLDEYLAQFRDRKLVLIVAPISEGETLAVICGFALNEVGECASPGATVRCKLERAERAREIVDTGEDRDVMRPGGGLAGGRGQRALAGDPRARAGCSPMAEAAAAPPARQGRRRRRRYGRRA